MPVQEVDDFDVIQTVREFMEMSSLEYQKRRKAGQLCRPEIEASRG